MHGVTGCPVGGDAKQVAGVKPTARQGQRLILFRASQRDGFGVADHL